MRHTCALLATSTLPIFASQVRFGEDSQKILHYDHRKRVPLFNDLKNLTVSYHTKESKSLHDSPSHQEKVPFSSCETTFPLPPQPRRAAAV